MVPAGNSYNSTPAQKALQGTREQQDQKKAVSEGTCALPGHWSVIQEQNTELYIKVSWLLSQELIARGWHNLSEPQ